MKMKKDNKIIIIGAIAAVTLGVIAISTIPKKKDYDYENMSKEEIQVAVDEKLNEIEKKDLSAMGERDRIEYYLSSFIDAIENKKYEEAYEMLYEDFKTNYFPTLASFEEYAPKTFPKICVIEYTNIERNGNVYIVWATMSSALAGKDTGVEMKFVIQENGLNDFDLSFSVI